MIAFTCPQCRSAYDAGDEVAGRKAECGVCGCKFLVAAEPAAAGPAAAAPAAPAHLPVPRAAPSAARRLSAAPARHPARGRAPWLVGGLALAGLAAGFGGWLAFSPCGAVDAGALAAPAPPPMLVPAPGVEADGVLHQWNFDEARDWHDSPYGPLTNAPASVFDLAGGWDMAPVGLTPTNWVSGREFMAVLLPGGAAHLEAGRDLAAELGGTASLAFWLRTTQRGGQAGWDSPGIAGAVNAKHKNGVQWGWLDQEGRLALSADQELLACTPVPVNDGKWHFVALTRDAATGAGQVYLDGALADARTGPRGKRALPFRSLGRIEGGAAGGLAGRLDKLTVFNRVVSAGEVRAFMANHAPKAWDCRTEGPGDRPFVTESIFAHAYDVENDALAVRGWTRPAHGAVTCNGDGSFTYAAAAGYLGDDAFAVVVQDGKGGFHRAAMKVTLAGPAGDGAARAVTNAIAAIEAIYDAHSQDPGVALSADGDALLGKVNEANRSLAALLEKGAPGAREAAYAALAAHVRKYPFLKYQKLDTQRFHHVPSIVLQNWVFLTHARPDTPAHRREVAEVMGLSGTARDIFLESSLALGDNATLDSAQLGSVRDMMRHQPRELFPDCIITFDQLFGDKRGGFIWTPDSTKNTFGCGVGMANEWDRDLTQAIEKVSGKGAADGDYFTFVMGHEVTHSMDGYVSSRANKDLRRRWGQVLCHAAGPDIVAGANGWIDWGATRKHFQDAGFFSPPGQTWEQAWKAYWDTGPGAKFRHTSFMRGGIGIDWFLGAPQESLATQANNHWASGPGRLIGAVARFRRGVATGNLPEKGNITEVVDFIDYLSVGMNRVALPKTTTVTKPEKRVEWTVHLADLERDDNGRITRIGVDGYTYEFTLDAAGTVTDVRCSVPGL